MKSAPTLTLRSAFAAAVVVMATGLPACGGGDDNSAPGALTLADCFGVEALAKPGVTFDFNERITTFDAQGNVASSLLSSYTRFVNPDVVFEGAPRFETVYRITGEFLPGAPFESVARMYTSSDAPTRYTLYGRQGQATSTNAGTTFTSDEREVMNPPVTYDLGVGVGGSVTVTTTSTTTSTTTVNGVVEGPTSSTVTTTETIRFAGVDTITVPAGTFNTCRVETNSASVTWYIPSTGIPARSDEFDASGNLEARIELMTLTRNGAPF